MRPLRRSQVNLRLILLRGLYVWSVLEAGVLACMWYAFPGTDMLNPTTLIGSAVLVAIMVVPIMVQASKVDQSKRNGTNLDSEPAWSVELSDGKVTVSDPAGRKESIHLDAVRKITIKTNDTGPFESDIMWNLHDKERLVPFPMGTIGEEQAVDALMKLPGFNHEEMIAAMGCTDNKVFLLYNDSD